MERDYYTLEQASEISGYTYDDLIHFGGKGDLSICLLAGNFQVIASYHPPSKSKFGECREATLLPKDNRLLMKIDKRSLFHFESRNFNPDTEVFLEGEYRFKDGDLISSTSYRMRFIGKEPILYRDGVPVYEPVMYKDCRLVITNGELKWFIEKMRAKHSDKIIGLADTKSQVNNDFEYSGLLNLPKNKDEWVRVIDDMVRSYFDINKKLPDKSQAWAQLCSNQIKGYNIEISEDRCELCLKILGFDPLPKTAFEKRWDRYTKTK